MMHAPARLEVCNDVLAPAPAETHAVQFYESEDFLFGAVADFLGAGLRAGERVLVVATEEHRQGFWHRIRLAGFDLEGALGEGRLTFLDARETLSNVLIGEMPDWDLFRARIGSALESSRVAACDGRIRAFGEMVDLLWREGRREAAIRLEEMWNELGRMHSFSLLCAYVMGNFYKEADADQFQRICGTHSHVLPAESFPLGDGLADARLREIAVLQQRARALETEIEHRKELERALLDALSDRKRLADELRRQNDELSRKVRFGEMFVGILGHDLRNPLSAITTAASLLARRADSEKLARPSQRILSSAGRMARMIDQLLDFTRIRLGKGLPLERRRIDLAEVCRLAIDELESATDAHRVRLDIVGDVLGVWDSDRIAQLVSNLLGNALAHGEEAAPVLLHVDGCGEHAVVVEVHNAGRVPPDVLEVMFEPFKSAGDKKQERSSGLGLGLYITQQIVLAHSGRIAVVSSESDGTRLTVWLPRSSSKGQVFGVPRDDAVAS
jgi:signal transduction histidine kinase